MPIKTKRKKIKLPFFTFQVVTGWEATPLTAAQKKKRRADREKARQEQAKEAQRHLQAHASRQPVKKQAEPTTSPARPVGAAGHGPAKTRTRSSGNLCGQPTKQGGTCKRVVTNVPCPDHPAGKPKGSR